MKVIGHLVRVGIESGAGHNYGIRSNSAVKAQHHLKDPYDLQQRLLLTSPNFNNDLS